MLIVNESAMTYWFSKYTIIFYVKNRNEFFSIICVCLYLGKQMSDFFLILRTFKLTEHEPYHQLFYVGITQSPSRRIPRVPGSHKLRARQRPTVHRFINPESVF